MFTNGRYSCTYYFLVFLISYLCSIMLMETTTINSKMTIKLAVFENIYFNKPTNSQKIVFFQFLITVTTMIIISLILNDLHSLPNS
jgi:hypothetical protein